MKVEVVKTEKQFDDFVKLAWKIYPKSSPWVPPLVSDLKVLYSSELNPFWLHAQREFFLVYDDNGNPVGKIAAIIDRNYLEFQNDACGFFGFFECINDIAAAKALYEAAFNWLKSKGINKMMGPMNPGTNDEVGFVCEGFNLSPSLMMAYTPQYYLDLAQKCGLTKIKELYAYDMDVANDSRVKRLERIVEMAKRKMPALVVRPVDLKKFRSELKLVMSVYNRAWEKNWGFVPWTDEEFEDLAVRIKPLVDPNLAVIALMNGSPVGMLVAAPDYNKILKKMNGKMFPFGWAKFLYYKNKLDSLRLLIMGVVKEYHNKGIEAIMYSKTLNYAISKGYKHCELSWVLDDNIPTQRTSEMMGGKIYKRYAIYQKLEK
ncbi:MAG: hypothetical protein LBC07_06285 [Elusimicrobiota bacterium]|jgi:GNAT superfamily N-acetyltransferase|nr:hypothetical protein [Elusimicrobiota bacterium]